MSVKLTASAHKVQAALDAYGLTLQVVELAQTTRSAKDAADAVGCQLGQIVKSLVFRTKTTQQPILVAASGPNRVNEAAVERHLPESIAMADADFVRTKTGFAIGGVPPVGHIQKLTIFIDEDLLQFSEIWAAAGNPRAVFKLTPQDLLRITEGKAICITA